MKKAAIIFGLLGLVLVVGLYAKRKFYGHGLQPQNTANVTAELLDSTLIKDGDIIFQTSRSQQSKSIQLATNSKYRDRSAGAR